MPLSDWEIPPPANVTVTHEHKPTLYLADGRPLVRQAGFTAGGTMQTSSVNPKLTTGKKYPKGKKGPGGRAC